MEKVIALILIFYLVISSSSPSEAKWTYREAANPMSGTVFHEASGYSKDSSTVLQLVCFEKKKGLYLALAIKTVGTIDFISDRVTFQYRFGKEDAEFSYWFQVRRGNYHSAVYKYSFQANAEENIRPISESYRIFVNKMIEHETLLLKISIWGDYKILQFDLMGFKAASKMVLQKCGFF